jgi:hypothetical protein
MVKIEREIPIQIDPGENPFLKGIYAPRKVLSRRIR